MRWICNRCKHVAIGREAPERCPVCGAPAAEFAPFAGIENLGGTRTEANLKAALAGESQANRRYLAFAVAAECEGETEAAEAFRRAAEDETAHALSHLGFLGLPGGTRENLKAAIEGETYENDRMYPEFARIAREEGFGDVARYFEAVAGHERRHAQRFTGLLREPAATDGGAATAAVEGGANVVEVRKGNVLDEAAYRDNAVNKVTNLKTEQIGVDTYYFRPGQVLDYHKHPGSDQVFFIIAGEGTFYLDDGVETQIEVRPGSIVLAPADVLHKLVNTGEGNLVATQATHLA